MNKIEVKLISCSPDITKLMVCAARLTQHGEKIKSYSDFLDLYNKPFTYATVNTLLNLPHTSIQKLGIINIVIIGASRRFLAQITRHQNEVKFVSASLQYSDYSNDANFVVPYNMLNNIERTKIYLNSCNNAVKEYNYLIQNGLSHDEASYLLPQGLRNVLIISATPYQWKHMISQRTCNRNTLETQYIMLKCWQLLFELDTIFFAKCGPNCITSGCKEGKMICSTGALKYNTPSALINYLFPLLGDKNE